MLAVWLLLPNASPVRAVDPGLELFEKKIRPMLVEHCYKCHSNEARIPKGGLLLDTREGLLKGGDTGPALVPGKPKESLLLKAMRYTEDELRMPPKGKLADELIADLEKWIALGAPDPRTGNVASAKQQSFNLETARQFWSLQPLKRHPVPVVKDTTWPKTDIDRFLLARLEASNIRPVADADRATLIRRAYFDLLGLPPTPEQIDAFVNDPSPQAFAKVVDELLASPHFGERWGRHWLDVARYADSSGGGRSLLFPDAWRYRDYVIDAFNRDKPYNRFMMEQMAGDLLPVTTPEQRREQLVATAFLALGPTNYERQDKDSLEMDVIDEQLDTMGRTFLGLTIGCARCHDHKFDPIPTKDYYALAGIMRSTQTLIHDNVSRWVDLPLPMQPEQEAAAKKHEAAVAALKDKIQLAKSAEKKSGKLVASAIEKGALSPKSLPGIVLDDADAKQVGQWRHSTYSGNFIGTGSLYDDRSIKSDKTITFVPEFAKTGRYEVRLAYIAHTNRDSKVPVTILHLDGESTVYVNQRETPPIDGRFVSLGTYSFNRNGQWFVMVSNTGTTGHISVDAVQFLPEEMVETVKETAPPKPQSASAPPDSKKLEAELKKLVASAPPRPVAMSVQEAAKIGDGFVCIRGNIHNRGETVPRGFLQVLSAPGYNPNLSAKESGRRELAEWLARPDNPLPARVMANRIWHYLFGTGLVRTVDEFGKTGELPSHPELLDYLALQFIDEGWSVKKFIRALMLSHAYQLSSAQPRTNAPSADPENRLIGRMSRRRLDAEAIRDAILAVSGQLDRSMGGPTVRKGTTSEYGYLFDDTRRSVYTPIFRNRLLELFEAFDFADPNLVMGRRNVSTVATQALYLMNNPFMMEQARHAAKAMRAIPNLDDTGRLDRAYRLTLGRLPTEPERKIALKFLDEDRSPERQAAAWERLYQTLFACIDFRYVN